MNSTKRKFWICHISRSIGINFFKKSQLSSVKGELKQKKYVAANAKNFEFFYGQEGNSSPLDVDIYLAPDKEFLIRLSR